MTKTKTFSLSYFSWYSFRFQSYILYSVLAVVSVLFLLIFSYYTSPITQIYGYDASFFQLVGQGMKRGMYPYRDFFDMKGPYMFLIEYIGQLLCDGRTGIFLVQFVSLYFTLIFILKIHRILHNGKKYSLWFEVLSLFPYLWIAAATFEGGNLTEEFCLPALTLCMYCYLRYAAQENSIQHPLRYAFIYGLSFGYITLIRITSTSLICAIVLCAFVSLLLKKLYRNIFDNAVFFILGFVAAITPAIIYCLYHGILSNMIYSVFVFGYTYAAEDGLFDFSLSQLKYFLPMLIPIIMCCLSSKRKKLLFPAFVMFAAQFLSLSMGNHYPHYFTTAIPYIALGGALFAENISQNFKNMPVILCCFASVALCIIPLSSRVLSQGRMFTYSAFNDYCLDHLARDISTYIPAEEKMDVYTWGISSKWYLETNTYPCIKYCDWQQHYISLVPEIRTELKQIFSHHAPTWFVTKKGNQLPDFLQNELSSQYEEYISNDAYTLYRCIS